jgi:isoleucyl-tRNA synthetase
MTIEIAENELSTDVSLVLDMSIDDALLSKGLAREIIRRIQSQRKEMDLDMEASIKLEVWLGEECPELVEYDWAHLRNETRASHATLHVGEGPSDAIFFDVDGANISFKIN